MAKINIDETFASLLANKAVVVTGAWSGIGLTTVQRLLSVGAFVVNGDVNLPETTHEHLTSVQVDVRDWAQLCILFDTATAKRGRIDHVFANAGVPGRANYLEDSLDSEGRLQELDHTTLEITLKAVANTAYLAIHHLQHQDPAGGSVL